MTLVRARPRGVTQKEVRMHIRIMKCLGVGLIVVLSAAGAARAADEPPGAEPDHLTGWPRRRALICFCTPTIRSTGIPGGQRRWRRPRPKTSRSFCRSGIARVTGAM